MPPSITTTAIITETRHSKGRRSPSDEDKAYHRIIYCPVTDITFEGFVKSKQKGQGEDQGSTLNYIKHGKGTIHHHKSLMTISGYFHNDEILGHGVQTLYDSNGRSVKAQYEGPFLSIGSNNYVRNGMGKYSWPTVGDLYCGEFTAGVIHGRGTFTWGNGDSYQGIFKKGLMQGENGIMKTFSTGDVYEGPFKKGKAHGWGKKSFGNGDVFEGMYRYETRLGFGTYVWNDSSAYVGKWNEGLIEGRGMITRFITQHGSDTLADVNPDFHFGAWSGGLCCDYGVRMYTNGDHYTGEFHSGLRSGYGIYKFSNDDVYEGFFTEGKCHGLGIKRMNNGDVYDGEWQDGKAHGYGIKTFHLCGDVYQGFHENDERQGHGVYRWVNGHVYEGDFHHDERTGFGCYIWNNSISYQGSWMKGARNGPGFLYTQRQDKHRVFFNLWNDGKCIYQMHIQDLNHVPLLEDMRKKGKLIHHLKTQILPNKDRISING
jgi:hypothetical protein